MFAKSSELTKLDMSEPPPLTLFTSSNEARNVFKSLVLCPKFCILSDKSSTATELTSALVPISSIFFDSPAIAATANKTPTMPRRAFIAIPSVVISIVKSLTAALTIAITLGAIIIIATVEKAIFAKAFVSALAFFHASAYSLTVRAIDIRTGAIVFKPLLIACIPIAATGISSLPISTFIFSSCNFNPLTELA